MTHREFTAPEIEELEPLFPSYEFVSLIAVGGMGAVYRAVQVSLDREVAVKLLPRALGENEEFRHQFEEEAKSMARMNHPNLLGVIDFGSADGMPFIVMEYVHGSSLHHAVNGMPVESLQTAEVMIQVVSAIAHAHENGMLHRDIKPANILLDQNFNAKVADFGLAKQVGQELDEKVIWGTPGYTSPEVMQAANNASEKSDIYALGGVMYFLLTSKTPDPNDIHLAKLGRCDPRFREILTKCLCVVPAMRYDSAKELLTDLEKLMPLLEQQPSLGAVAPSSGTAANVPTTPLSVFPGAPAVAGVTPGAVAYQPVAYTHGAGVQASTTGPASAAISAPIYQPTVKSGQGKGGVIIAASVVALLTLCLGVYFFVAGSEADEEVKEPVDYSEKSIAVTNASFEEPTESKTKDVDHIDGWKYKKLSSDHTFKTVAMNGGKALMLQGGAAYATTSVKAEQGYTYTLEFSIARADKRQLEANRDYKINITFGENTPAASFRTKKQLPIKGEADMVRYSLSHDTKADHPSFKNPIGIRIIAKRCTIFIDDIKFKYHRIKE